MAVLSPEDVENLEESFIELLTHAPGTKEDKQSFFNRNLEITVPKTNYWSMWERLIENVGFDQAGEAIFDLILHTATPRLQQLLKKAQKGHMRNIYQKDYVLIHDLFWDDGDLQDIGELLVEYISATDYQWLQKSQRGIIKRRLENPSNTM